MASSDKYPNRAAYIAALQAATSPGTRAARPIFSTAIQALKDTPVMASPPTLTLQATAPLLSDVVSTVTGTLLTPDWVASTFYKAGQAVADPSTGTLIQRIADGTSRASYDAAEQALWSVAPIAAPVENPIRWNAAILERKLQNGQSHAWGPRSPKRTDGNESGTVQPVQWTIDFDWYTAAGALEVPIYNTAQVRFVIDGQYLSAAPITGASDFGWKMLKLSGVAAGMHRMRIEVAGQWPHIGGVKIATGDAVLPSSYPRTRTVALVHDSYGEGAVGPDHSTAPISGDARGYSALLGRILGITNHFGCSVSGSGIVTSTNSQYLTRLPDLVAIQPDYALIMGSVNDSSAVATTLPAGALAYFQALKAALPNTKVLVVGCVHMGSSSAGDAITAVLKSAMITAGIVPGQFDFLDTTGWSPPASATALTASDSFHPSVLGAEYLARRYAAGIRSFWPELIG